jgi:hypothetical protein
LVGWFGSFIEWRSGLITDVASVVILLAGSVVASVVILVKGSVGRRVVSGVASVVAASLSRGLANKQWAKRKTPNKDAGTCKDILGKAV